MAKVVPFPQRFPSETQGAPIDDAVAESARIGLFTILSGMVVDPNYPLGWSMLTQESMRTGRKLRSWYENASDPEMCSSIINDLAWDKFYVYCERIYRLMYDAMQGHPDTDILLKHYTDELNELLAEENLAYEMVDGVFQRRGRPQTQKSFLSAGAVLASPLYVAARIHYNKARKFFDQRPSPDDENCIKEAVCALEAFAEIQLGKKAAKDFDAAIRSRQGQDPGDMPLLVGEGIIKLRAFRGNAQGVAHAALAGPKVGVTEAELVLSLVASYITYLYANFPKEVDEVPF